jgi:hypothetical protein
MPKTKTVNRKRVLSPKVEIGLKQDLQRMARSVGVEVEEVDTSIPGTKVDKYLPTARKIPFSLQWFKDKYEMVEITPEETVPVTINGVRIQFETDKTITVPAPFASEYHRYRQQMRNVARSGLKAGSVLPDGVVGIIPGAGGLTPEDTEG